jgi:hypothetical protein
MGCDAALERRDEFRQHHPGDPQPRKSSGARVERQACRRRQELGRHSTCWHLETPEDSLYEGMTVHPVCVSRRSNLLQHKDDELFEKVEVHPKPVYGYNFNAPIMQ